VCAVVTTPPAGARPAKPALPGGGFGNLMQSFDATEYRGRMIRLRASLRLDSVSRNDRAQMWVRVDCVQGMACGFDNMDDRPVRSATWKNAEIRVRVPEDAVTIYFGVMSLGHGRAWIDEISLESGPK
jgi:hypothetical protein